MGGEAAEALERNHIDAILIGNGPGSFAGLRIALAFAKGLARGLDVPIVAVNSLDAMLREPVAADVAILKPSIRMNSNTMGIIETIDAISHSVFL